MIKMIILMMVSILSECVIVIFIFIITGGRRISCDLVRACSDKMCSRNATTALQIKNMGFVHDVSKAME